MVGNHAAATEVRLQDKKVNNLESWRWNKAPTNRPYGTSSPRLIWSRLFRRRKPTGLPYRGLRQVWHHEKQKRHEAKLKQKQTRVKETIPPRN